MSLTVKHLNGDSSFLLTFAPILSYPPSPGQQPSSFTILIDPWLSGPSKIWHSKFSISTLKTPSCVSSLQELPEPDIVLISQDKTDHCHEQTLKELPSNGAKTLIFAEPSAARKIKSWKYFDSSKVIPLPHWEDPRLRRIASTIQRIPIPATTPNGMPGEVTIAFLAQKNDLTGLHSAIGITYRPPSIRATFEAGQTLPLTPPASPRSFQSTFSSSTLDRALSVIYSPHGCTYKTIAPYATSHLISEAALPLTALLHCFDRITNRWYLGGNICSGFPGGLEIAQNLCAKAWISAHDGEKDTRGFASSKVVKRKWDREEVESVVSPRSEKFPEGAKTGTQAVVLGVGGEITLSQAMRFGPGTESINSEEVSRNPEEVSRHPEAVC